MKEVPCWCFGSELWKHNERQGLHAAGRPHLFVLGWVGGLNSSSQSLRRQLEAAASFTVAFLPQGVEVQTDYVPLLNSLAAYGWQLTCVLPTPVVKTNR